MFATALVNYVVPDPMQATMHAHDSTFMQFRAFRFPPQDTNPRHTHQECSGSEMENVWGTCMNFNTDSNPEFVCQPLFVI
jgi:hypothetical protein